jgi:hypothetical protein
MSCEQGSLVGLLHLSRCWHPPSVRVRSRRRPCRRRLRPAQASSQGLHSCPDEQATKCSSSGALGKAFRATQSLNWAAETDSRTPPASRANDRPMPGRYVHRLMAQMGRNALWSPEVVLAAVELCRPVAMRKHIVSTAECFFRTKACLVPKGLRRLPSCWLMAIPNILWKRRRPHWTHLPHS